MDISILIVHHNTPGLLRQTLKGIIQSKPQLNVEILVVDNNPKMRIEEMVKTEFPAVQLIKSEKNLGFGGGMNLALSKASGRYLFVFNPDIATFEGELEKLVAFMDANEDIGIVGPKLLNPDKSVQMSCNRFATPQVIASRRIPLLRSTKKAKSIVKDYLMHDWDHNETKNVDYLLGAAILIRRKALEEVGYFDPAFFMYFEDQDLCRRFWLANWRVVYHPEAKFVHYHRRETAQGNFLSQVLNPLTRIQLKSAIYYFKKYKDQGNPREHYERRELSNA